MVRGAFKTKIAGARLHEAASHHPIAIVNAGETAAEITVLALVHREDGVVLERNHGELAESGEAMNS